ncbi:hypothetical protein BDV10DRAFT_63065 [Aspergillus recurvatus]
MGPTKHRQRIGAVNQSPKGMGSGKLLSVPLQVSQNTRIQLRGAVSSGGSIYRDNCRPCARAFSQYREFALPYEASIPCRAHCCTTINAFIIIVQHGVHQMFLSVLRDILQTRPERHRARLQTHSLECIIDMWHPQTDLSGILSVGMAEITLLHSTLLEHINSNVQMSPVHLSYNSGGKHVRNPPQGRLALPNRHFNPFRAVEPYHVLMADGCSSTLST